MNRTNPRGRRGSVKYVLLVLLILAGGGAGWYLSRERAIEPEPSPPAPSTLTHRFPLTALDVRESIETPELAIDQRGRVYLAWASRTDSETRQLFLTRSDDAGKTFDEPRSVATSGIYRAVSKMKGKTITRELKMVPHLAIGGETIHLAWTEALPDGSGVRTVVADSTDAGKKFGPARAVHHADGARTTFTAFTAGADGTLACSWLDNRDKSQQPFASLRPSEAEEFLTEQVVHAGQDGRGVCPCCPTDALLADDGTLYVAFRNLQDGHRDIAVSVRRPGASEFEGPFPVVPPTWEFNGCPHDGPSMALVEDHLRIVWMDAHSGSPRCYSAVASLEDMDFRVSELNPIANGSQGNARIVADVSGGLHAVWEESSVADAETGSHSHGTATGSGSERTIMYAYAPGVQESFGPARAVLPKAESIQTRPALAVSRTGEVFIAWQELDENGKSVVVTRLERRPERE